MRKHSVKFAKLLLVMVFIILAFSLLSDSVVSDTWVSYGPRSFYTHAGGEYVAEIFPPRYRLNMKGSRTLCYLYHFDELEDRTYKFALIWRDTLASYLPDRVFLTEDGYLITLDPEHRHNDDVIVIYSPSGIIIRSFPLDSLLDSNSRDISHSVTARWWYDDARFFSFSFIKPSSFYILLKSGKAMEFNLKDGHYTLAHSSSFPTLVDEAQRSYSNYEFRKINYIDLRFSSITEMLNAHNSKWK